MKKKLRIYEYSLVLNLTKVNMQTKSRMITAGRPLSYSFLIKAKIAIATKTNNAIPSTCSDSLAHYLSEGA